MKDIICNREICMYCGACVGTCPVNCIFLAETQIQINKEKCTFCNMCVRVCPVGAITITV